MKSWLTKARYGEMNRLMDKVCKQELGYPYQDGTKSRSRGNVERVKVESLRAEAAGLTAEIDTLRHEVAELDKTRQKARQDAARATQEADKAVTRARAAELAQKRSEEAQRQSEARAEAAEESICNLAETCWVNHTAVLRMQQEKSDAEKAAQHAERDAERRAHEISLDEARKRAGRDARLERYERMEQEFPQVFREMDSRLTRTVEHERTR